MKEIKYVTDGRWTDMRLPEKRGWFAAYRLFQNPQDPTFQNPQDPTVQQGWRVLYGNDIDAEDIPMSECTEEELRERIITKCMLLGMLDETYRSDV